MLMYEVASAADTLELWKMINDSVWSALQKIQKDEEVRKAAQRRSAAVKRGARKVSASKRNMQPFKPVPVPTPVAAAAAQLQPQSQRAAPANQPQPQPQKAALANQLQTGGAMNKIAKTPPL